MGGEFAVSAVLEAIMLVCFGLSWPINAMKAWRAKTAAGTSWMFLALITFGYIAGIAAKFASGSINWVLAVYFINLVALIVNWIVFARNRILDRGGRCEKGSRHAPMPSKAISSVAESIGTHRHAA